MSPLQVLVLPDALRSPNQGHIRAGCPLVGSRTAPRREDENSPSPPFSLSLSFFFLYNCRPFVGNLSLTTSAPCLPLSYSLPVVHSVTVCFTLNRPLSHSLSPTSIIYLFSIAVSFSLAAFLSLVNSSFSQLSPLSAHSLYLPRALSHSTSIAALHLFPSFCPIIFPFNSETLCFHSALLAVSIWMNTSHCISPPLSSSVLPSLSLHLLTVPSVFAKHWEPENHHSVNLLLLHESAATFIPS